MNYDRTHCDLSIYPFHEWMWKMTERYSIMSHPGRSPPPPHQNGPVLLDWTIEGCSPCNVNHILPCCVFRVNHYRLLEKLQHSKHCQRRFDWVFRNFVNYNKKTCKLSLVKIAMEIDHLSDTRRICYCINLFLFLTSMSKTSQQLSTTHSCRRLLASAGSCSLLLSRFSISTACLNGKRSWGERQEQTWSAPALDALWIDLPFRITCLKI